MSDTVTVIGGGLAGCEAAWQAARSGAHVVLCEMRPHTTTPAHTTGELAELVCSNSLGSNLVGRAPGLLKEELRRLGSLVIDVADATCLPAGSALAVDREGFAAAVTARIEANPAITLVRREITDVPNPAGTGPVIIASGPLTSPSLTQSLQELMGRENLYFFDAIAPIVEAESIDMSIAFRASRYDRGESEDGDYINCPMTEAEYDAFYEALVGAERIPLPEFDTAFAGAVSEAEAADHCFFEGCLPVEVLAARGKRALAFGPLRPVGLSDPRTGGRPYAVVQLRQDDAAGTLYNLVGFQTNLRYGEQDRVLRMIPGLGGAEFVRYGSMHRNTYVNAPALLQPTLQLRPRHDLPNAEHLLVAGQVAGLEGYAGNVAGGWLAGVNAARLLTGLPPVTMPEETMIGALMHYITHAAPKGFQPMKANFGLMPPLETRVRGKRARGEAHSERALASLAEWLETHPELSA